MLAVWFMYDNHTFKRVGDAATPREEMVATARHCFIQDGHGVLFMREAGMDTLRLHGHGLPGEEELGAFFDRIEERFNWICRG